MKCQGTANQMGLGLRFCALVLGLGRVGETCFRALAYHSWVWACV